ncbi:hypothetical protein T484DRAFT_1878407, partial [Baffinella frigidus]
MLSNSHSDTAHFCPAAAASFSSSSPSSSATAGEKAAAAAAADAGRKWWGPRSAGAQEVAGCEARAMAAKVAAQDTELATLRAKNRYLQRMREEAEEALGSGGIEARSMAATVAAQAKELAMLYAKFSSVNMMLEKVTEAAAIEARSMAATVAAQDTELATLRAAAAKVTETQVAQRDVLESVQRTNRSLQRRQEEMEEMVEMRVMAAKVEAKDVTVAALELAVALRAELKESSTAAAVTERKAVAEVCGLMDERDSILAQHSALAATS